jgi:hypothetical protein
MTAYSVPNPPTTAVMPAVTQTVLILVMSTVAACWLVAMVVLARRQKSLIPLYITIGGVLSLMYEPLGDWLELAWYPAVDQVTAVQFFGRSVPLFIGLLFVFYFGAVVVALTKLVDSGLTWRKWWIFSGGILLGQTIFEMICLAFGHPWLYYGNQPFVLLNLPLWIMFTCVSFEILGGAGVYAIQNYLRPQYHWLAIPAMPVLFLAGHGASALPGALALHSTDNTALIWLGATGSIAVSVLIVWFVGLVFIESAKPKDAGAVVRTAVGQL